MTGRRAGRIAVVLTCLAQAAGCTCGTSAVDGVFPCTTLADCASGFVCDPIELICARSADGGGGGSGGGGGAGGGTGGGGASSACGAACQNGSSCDLASQQCICRDDAGIVEVTETQCDDAADNDCDGLTDCKDPQCTGAPCGAGNGFLCVLGGACTCNGNGGTSQPVETNCTDGRDNDCDGLADCLDPDCNSQTCAAGFFCQATACVCVVDGGMAAASETSCSDNRDNDCNGRTDCLETSCLGQTCGTGAGRSCQADGGCACGGNGGTAEPLGETTCDDARDNDCDSLTDCQDPQCNARACGANGLRCAGSSCACSGNGGTAQPGGETSCSDGFDNDCDGLTDCADPGCAAACVSTCNTFLSTAHATRGGRGQAVELGGTPRYLFTGNGAGATVDYVECTSGCTTAAPVWSAPLALDTSYNIQRNRAGLGTDGTGLFATWVRGTTTTNEFIYAECTGACATSLAQWTRLVVTPSCCVSSAVEGRGARRVAIFEGRDGGGTYAECNGNCAASAANWSQVGFGVDCSTGAVALWTPADGGTGSAIAFGSEPTTGSPLYYAECPGACAVRANWVTVTLGFGAAPSLVFDSQQLPRIFYNLTAQGTGGTAFKRCTARPCSSAGNWTAGVTLSTAAGFVSTGHTPDGGTFAMLNGAGVAALAAVESGNAYAVTTLTGCDGGTSGMTGEFPAGLLGPGNKWRVFHSGTSGNYQPVRYRFEGP